MSNGISVPELVEQLGFEELKAIGQEEIAADFLPASITGFADGDLCVLHETYAGKKAELYGEHSYGEGRVAQAMGRAALEIGRTPGLLYDFQGFAADYFTDSRSIFSSHNPRSTVHISPNQIVVDDYVMPLSQPPAFVFDYNACLTSQSYIADQMQFLNSGVPPFGYAPLTRSHFMNRTLMNTYDAKYGRGTTRAVIENQLYIGREDGVAGATNEVIRSQKANNAPVEVADIIIATGTQHATTEDLKRGIENASVILKDGGKLIMRSVVHPAEGEMGIEELTSWAFEAGFSEKNTIRRSADLHNIGTLMTTGHFGDRVVQTVIVTK